jgi:hypothetical protein
MGESGTLKQADAFNELGQVFIDVLPDYFKDDPTGFALTGGLDTRMILAGIFGKNILYIALPLMDLTVKRSMLKYPVKYLGNRHTSSTILYRQ